MKGRVIYLWALGLLFLVVIGISVHLGPVSISTQTIWEFLIGTSKDNQSSFILSHLRIPRTIAAALIGASLGICGLVLQTILKNPLAEPYTLGLSGGSSVGAMTALLFSFEPAIFWMPALSTIGCLLSVLLVVGISHRSIQFESRSIILFGVMISLFFGAVVVTGLSILSPTKLQSVIYWLMGEFGTTRDMWIKTLGPLMILIMAFIFSKSPSLDAMALGEERALSLGVNPKTLRISLVLACTLLTSMAVSIAGLVGFVGLVSPHVARRFLNTSSHRTLIVATAFLGGSLLVFADSLGRAILTQGEIPAGSVAALIGAPTLIYLLSKPHKGVALS